MKKFGVGLLELLICAAVIIIVYLTFFHNSNYGRSNPFDDNSGLSTKQDMVESKINEIENTKQMKKRIEMNLKKGY